MPKFDPRKGELIGVIQKSKLLGGIERAGLIFAVSRLSGAQLDQVYAIFEDARPAIEAEDIEGAYNVLRRHGFSEEMIDGGRKVLGVVAKPAGRPAQDRSAVHGPSPVHRADGIG